LLKQVRREHEAWLRERSLRPRNAAVSDWIEFLKLRIGAEMGALEKLRRLYARFDRAFNAARSREDQIHLILNFARDLGASPRDLKKDRAAFDRWFGADAIRDRYHRRHAQHEQYAAFLLDRLAATAAHLAQRIHDHNDQLAFWKLLELESILKPLLVHDGDARLNLAAFRCLSGVLSALAPEIQEHAVDDTTLQYIYRSALQHQQQVWIQCAALDLLVTLSWSSFQRAIRQRILQPAGGDDLFVRRRAVELLARHYPRIDSAAELASAVLFDPSAFVRQALPKVAIQARADVGLPWMDHLVRRDPSPQVRAAAWLEWPALLSGLRDYGAAQVDSRPAALRIFGQVARQEADEFVLRVICLVAERSTRELVRLQEPFLDRWLPAAKCALLRLRCTAPSLKVRRWASQAWEFIWSETHPEIRSLRMQLAAFARTIPRGRSRRIPSDWLKDVDPACLGRIWSIVCRQDYDIQLESTWRGYKVTRGHVFGFRWWRWWHEFRHPSPDKRQAFPHTVGRLFDGEIHVPSAIMGELAQTKVPGEALHIADEAGWRPYLPLVDELTSSIEFGRAARPFRIFTSEGVTHVQPPRGWQRWRAAWKLTWRFRDYAEKRNWLASMQEPPSTYVRALKDLGFKIRFDTHPDEHNRPLPPDPMVQRFFPGVLLPASLIRYWDHFQNYFVSLYQNSITELALFILAFGGLFFVLHLFSNLRLKYWRKRLPLVIGGWGTRGKSGTERLKAALFNALGLGIVSKTTGCEAMFLQAYPFGPTKEMFLFRPYDKATIWEQVNVVRLAGRLKAGVMLWECMGLTPSYVRTLQRSWMRDDFSTITNTYPDHEDLQGPAGIDIPEVIGCFIPERSTLITSEEQMLPILATEAQRRGTSLHPVTWLEAGLIPDDILRRFPYEEHPYNIALVLGLAEHLGIDRAFALKEMADRVVPDLGVLKTYPTATIRTRRLEFTNGMSANERFGTLSNWARTGFDRQDFLKEPGVWLTTVVNNRADRVPRSQVFARILVNDLSADRHVLIGGNLNGLQGYIREAWSEKAPQLSLWKDPRRPSPSEGLEVLEQQALQMRLPIRADLIQNHLRIMIEAQPQLTTPSRLSPTSSSTLSPALSLTKTPEALHSPTPDLLSSDLGLQTSFGPRPSDFGSGSPVHGPRSTVHSPSGTIDQLLSAWEKPDEVKSRPEEFKLGEIETAIVDNLRHELEIYHEYTAFADQVRRANPDNAEALNQRFRQLLQHWFQGKIIVVEDYFASGDQVIELIARHTPPGFLNRIMGIQNIKGTGLDFVYRWQAWQTCHKAAEPLHAALHSALSTLQLEALAPLCAFQDYGVLCEEYVRDTIQRIKASGVQQPGPVVEQLDRILDRLNSTMGRIREKMKGGNRQQRGWLRTLILRLEEFLDPGDAVRRRTKADRIYEDLIAERISRDRAVAELQALTQRQKGGWLLKT